MAFKTLVGMITVIAAFIIILYSVAYPMTIKAKESGEAGVCGLQLYLLSVKNKVTFGLSVPKTPPKCRAKILTIDEKIVKEYLDDAEKAFKRYKADPEKYAEVLQFFDTESEGSRWEWALDKIIADQLFNCWAFKAVFGTINTIELLASDRVCLLCSLIKFKDAKKILEKIGQPKRPFIAAEDYIGSLGAFMRAETRGKGKETKTYYDWINNKYQFYPLVEVPYKIDPFSEYAIIYVMTKTPVDIDFGEGVTLEHQKNWIEFLPSQYLTSEKDYFGRVHKPCEGGILGT
ncbi:hypothetical protein DRJ25_00065 [Candidatus Woesearchaeota archaeon]|nr:MAG: hypothetical protein DRJ25_00065 [Candidatus Woesearchaeota archaeon]